MSTTNQLTIRVLGREFKAPTKYLKGYVFCQRTGRVYVSDKKPIRERGCWDLRGIQFEPVGTVQQLLSEVEATESIKPLKEYLVDDNGCFTEQGDAPIEEGRLYTWGNGASVYLRANKRVYLVEEHTGKLVDLGHFCEFPRLTTYYSGFRYISSWGKGKDE